MQNNENSVVDSKVFNLEDKGDQDDFNFLNIIRSIQKRKKLLFVVASFIFSLNTLFTIYIRIFKPIYRGSFTLLISDPINNPKKGNIQGEIFEELALNTSENDLPTLIAFMKSPFLLEPIAKKYEINLKSLEKMILIKTPIIQKKQAQGVLEVSILINNKNKGKKILSELSNSFLEASLKQKRQKLNDGLDFLNKQMPAIQNRTRKLQAQLADFREKNSLIEPLVEGGGLKAQQTEIKSLILQTEAEKNRLLNVKDKIISGRLSTKGFKEAIGSTTSGSGEGLSIIGFDQTLFNELQAIEVELAKSKSNYTPNSKIIKGLESHQARIKPLILKNQIEAVDTAISLSNDRLDTLKAQENDLELRFLEKPTLIREYNDIEQKLAISKQNLLGLISARDRFQLDMAQESVPWKVISFPKMEKNPIEPQLIDNLLLGIFYGLLGGIIISLIRDKLDYVFDETEEVKRSLNTSILGYVPYLEMFKDIRLNQSNILLAIANQKKNKNKKSDTYQRFFYQEAFRNIYTSIKYLSSDKSLKSISITSCIPKEGKSVLNTLLAKTLSELGKRVLQVDCDLRKPTIHTLLGLDNIKGISNVLIDNKINLEDVIQKVPGQKNWSVITAGVTPPDPARLLSSKRMKNIIKELDDLDKYDLIIYDTPPAVGLSDYLLLSENLDGLILIVTINNVNKTLPRQVMNRIIETKIPFLGCITNSIKKEESLSSVYGGGYGYGYGYGAYKYAYKDYADQTNSEVDNTGKLFSDNEKFEENLKTQTMKTKIFNIYKTVSQKISRIINWIEK